LIQHSRPLQVIAATITASVFFAGIALSKSAEDKATSSSKSNTVVNDPTFHRALQAIGAEYKNYGKVDDWARWAPGMCAMPPPPKARLSASQDTSSHGKKVYYLFAKDRDQYYKNEAPKPGQVVVKESWYPAAEVNGNPAASEKQGGLFIMMKLDPKSPGSDNGWVYGTVTSDGKTVTSAGRVQSCMGCHVSATNDRLFGLPK
jgi:hypothetical protein